MYHTPLAPYKIFMTSFLIKRTGLWVRAYRPVWRWICYQTLIRYGIKRPWENENMWLWIFYRSSDVTLHLLRIDCTKIVKRQMANSRAKWSSVTKWVWLCNIKMFCRTLCWCSRRGELLITANCIRLGCTVVAIKWSVQPGWQEALNVQCWPQVSRFTWKGKSVKPGTVYIQGQRQLPDLREEYSCLWSYCTCVHLYFFFVFSVIKGAPLVPAFRDLDSRTETTMSKKNNLTPAFSQSVDLD